MDTTTANLRFHRIYPTLHDAHPAAWIHANSLLWLLGQRISQEEAKLIRRLLGAAQQDTTDDGDNTDENQDEQETAPEQCPHCQNGLMRTIAEAPRPTIPQIRKLPLLVPI